MSKRLLIHSFISFICLVLFQVLILNNIQLGWYLNPMLYVLFIIQLPFGTPNWLILSLSFLLGFSVDMFSIQMGFHAFAATFAGFVKTQLNRFYLLDHSQDLYATPSLFSLSFSSFVLYSFVLIFVHHFVYLYVEIFSIRDFFLILFWSFLSSLFTLLLVLFLEMTKRLNRA